jgi:hypothetical protein
VFFLTFEKPINQVNAPPQIIGLPHTLECGVI